MFCFFPVLFVSCWFFWSLSFVGFPGGASGKEPACQCRRHKRHWFDLWVRKIPWRRAWQPSPVFLPGESHGQRSLAGYSPWDCRIRHGWSDRASMHSAFYVGGFPSTTKSETLKSSQCPGGDGPLCLCPWQAHSFSRNPEYQRLGSFLVTLHCLTSLLGCQLPL